MKRQITDLVYVFLAVLLAVGAIAATLPDAKSAKQSLEASGLKSVRILSLIIPCRLNGAVYLYGVFFDSFISPARPTNRACLNIRDMNWTIAEPSDRTKKG